MPSTGSATASHHTTGGSASNTHPRARRRPADGDVLATIGASALAGVLGAVGAHLIAGNGRPVLDHVRIRARGGLLEVIAANPYTLGSATLASRTRARAFDGLLTGASVREVGAALRSVRSPAATAEIVQGPQGPRVRLGERTWDLRDAMSFPETDILWPSASEEIGLPGGTIAFDPKILVRFARSASALAGGTARSTTTSLELHFHGPHRPTLVRIGETFRGLIMPMVLPGQRAATTVAANGSTGTPARMNEKGRQ